VVAEGPELLAAGALGRAEQKMQFVGRELAKVHSYGVTQAHYAFVTT
jgi:hypothetical protein